MIEPIVFNSSYKSAYKAGIWSHIVGMAKRVRYGYYQDYSIYFFNVSAILDQLNSNLSKTSGSEVFIDALNGIKATVGDVDDFTSSHSVDAPISDRYKSLVSSARKSLSDAMSDLRVIVAPSNSDSGAGGVGLGSGKNSDKVGQIKSAIDSASENLNNVGSLLKQYYKDKLTPDDYVHTDKNARTQEQLSEIISILSDELVDTTANIRSFSKLPFVYRTETQFDYENVPGTSVERVGKRKPGIINRVLNRYDMNEIRKEKHDNIIAVPKEINTIGEGSRQHAILGEAQNFIKFYNQWYGNFFKNFRIYPKPIGSIQALINPIVDDFESFSNNELLRTNEKAFDQATTNLVNQIGKVLRVLGQIKLS